MKPNRNDIIKEAEKQDLEELVGLLEGAELLGFKYMQDNNLYLFTSRFDYVMELMRRLEQLDFMGKDVFGGE